MSVYISSIWGWHDLMMHCHMIRIRKQTTGSNSMYTCFSLQKHMLHTSPSKLSEGIIHCHVWASFFCHILSCTCIYMYGKFYSRPCMQQALYNFSHDSSFSSGSLGRFPRDRVSGQDLQFSLPNGVYACDMAVFTIWCELANTHFTAINIPQDIFVSNI